MTTVMSFIYKYLATVIGSDEALILVVKISLPFYSPFIRSCSIRHSRYYHGLSRTRVLAVECNLSGGSGRCVSLSPAHPIPLARIVSRRGGNCTALSGAPPIFRHRHSTDIISSQSQPLYLPLGGSLFHCGPGCTCWIRLYAAS